MSTKKLTTEEFVRRAILRHGDAYCYDKTVYTNSRNKVIITCHEHGDFEQKANNHLNGQTCPECAKLRVIQLNTVTTDEFVRQSKLIHGEEYIYDKTVYRGAHSKVIITCRVHGDFEQTAYVHIQGSGCMRCYRERSKRLLTMTTEEFIARASELHDNKYTYDKVVCKGTKHKVIITCRVHGDFEQTVSHHLMGCGCKECANSSFVSKQETQWLDSLDTDTIQRQYSIDNMVVDGYDESTNTVYEYHGDYWHGNLDKFDRDYLNAHTGKTMGELNELTSSREQRIRDLGYNLVVMWESDWMKIRKELIVS